MRQFSFRSVAVCSTLAFCCGSLLTAIVVQIKQGKNRETSIQLLDLHGQESSLRFVGDWTIDRSDVGGRTDGYVSFDATGVYTDDSSDTDDTRWFYNDGVLYLVNRCTDIGEPNVFVHAFIPEVERDGASMKLSAVRGDYELTMVRKSTDSRSIG